MIQIIIINMSDYILNIHPIIDFTYIDYSSILTELNHGIIIRH